MASIVSAFVVMNGLVETCSKKFPFHYPV